VESLVKEALWCVWQYDLLGNLFSLQPLTAHDFGFEAEEDKDAEDEEDEEEEEEEEEEAMGVEGGGTDMITRREREKEKKKWERGREAGRKKEGCRWPFFTTIPTQFLL
jgi:hypothetical protein